MNELPDGWVWTNIGDITSDALQRQPTADEQFKYIDISSVDRLTKRVTSPQILYGHDAPSRARKIVATGDVLVSMTRPNLNAVAMVSPELDQQIASTGFDVLRPLQIEPRWLFYIVRSDDFVSAMSDLVQGALYPAIRSQDVRGYIVPLAPFNEQKRVVNQLELLLDRITACSNRLDRISSLLKRMREAVLVAATSGELTAEWREANKYKSPVDVLLADYATEVNYGTSAKSAASGLIPVLRMGNIQGGCLDWNNLVYTSDPIEIEKYALRPGDVLFNRTNSPELVGKTAVFNGEQQAIFAGYLVRFRCTDQLLPDYINYCLNSPKGRNYCWRVKSDGVSQSNINAKKLLGFRFLLPSLAEQQEIVRCVENLFDFADQLEARLQATRNAVDRVIPAILSKAFRGELVPQDPNDEPASVLLERIHSARTKVAPTTGPANRRVMQTQTLRTVQSARDLVEFLAENTASRKPSFIVQAAELDVDDFYAFLREAVTNGWIEQPLPGPVEPELKVNLDAFRQTVHQGI